MVSLVDLTTTAFQANVVLAVIFGAGYVFGKKTSATVLDRLARKVLLPSLIFTSLASSTFLTWHRLLQIAWPAVLLALITHVPSLLYAYTATRYFSAPSWTVPALTFNNTLSYPLLILVVLGHVSNDDSALGLLKWRVLDEISGVVDRATMYIIINWGLTEVARAFLAPVVDRLSPRLEEPEDDFDVPTPVHPVDEEDATETTPLVVRRKTSPKLGQIASRSTYTSPGVIAFVLGLLIALIKPVQRKLIGVTPDHEEGSWAWQSFGLGLYILGRTYAILDIVRFGVETREVESGTVVPGGPNGAAPGSNGDDATPEEVVVKAPATTPPTLGTVLTLSFWRYVVIPLYTIPFIHLLRKIPSTKAYLQDPVFSFVLVLIVLAPPTALPASHAFPAQTLFAHYLTSLILALPISIAFAQYGRGVSYDLNFNLVGALKSAGGGGLAGALAMIIQVLTLMPLRTIMNYQYRYGGTLKSASKTLYADGGFKRYYAGLAAALFQGPFARFGDTAANAFILALLATLTWPVLVKTIAASVASACFRMVLTPIDTLKTTQQTNGAAGGLKLLRERVRERGVACMWYGALATAAATFVGHYPWFATYNYLSAALPPPHNLLQKLLRQAFIGFAASVVSDTVSNSLRVVKTYRQVHEGDVGYVTAAKEIVASEGLLGLFGRGLGTRLLTNGLQGLLFSILWKFFADLIAGKA